MQARTEVVLPQFVELGASKVDNLTSILRMHRVAFDKVLVLYDDTTVSIGGQKIMSIMDKDRKHAFGHSVKNSDDANVENVGQTIGQNAPDLVIGFGGGKVLDVAKLAAAQHDTRFISIPTTLSNDGIASPVSVIKDAENIPISHITQPPYGVIIDIDIVKQAPLRHLMAGVGDLVSNLSAVFDARLAHRKKKERVDNNALELAEAGGLRLLELRTQNINTKIFLQHLAQGLVKSGFAMCISGTSRPASGSEHKISHSIDHYFPPSKGLHGEQVGIAAVFTMVLQKNESLQEMKKFYQRIAFPMKIDYLGLSVEQFSRVVLNATKIRPERYTILEDIRPNAADIRHVLKSARL
jgi:glycerol-1-phosphate dehydrogenase [NAD(P)+]